VFLFPEVNVLYLSYGRSVQPYFRRIFGAASDASFETRRDGVYVSELRSGSDTLVAERLILRTPIKATGSVETWMGLLLGEMQASVQFQCQLAAEEAAQLSVYPLGAPLSGRLRAFAEAGSTQTSEVLLRLLFTQSVTTAIAASARGEKNALRAAVKRASDVLAELLASRAAARYPAVCRKFETLVMLQVSGQDS
jgi:hypothetical protein